MGRRGFFASALGGLFAALLGRRAPSWPVWAGESIFLLDWSLNRSADGKWWNRSGWQSEPCYADGRPRDLKADPFKGGQSCRRFPGAAALLLALLPLAGWAETPSTIAVWDGAESPRPSVADSLTPETQALLQPSVAGTAEREPVHRTALTAPGKATATDPSLHAGGEGAPTIAVWDGAQSVREALPMATRQAAGASAPALLEPIEPSAPLSGGGPAAGHLVWDQARAGSSPAPPTTYDGLPVKLGGVFAGPSRSLRGQAVSYDGSARVTGATGAPVPPSPGQAVSTPPDGPGRLVALGLPQEPSVFEDVEVKDKLPPAPGKPAVTCAAEGKPCPIPGAVTTTFEMSVGGIASLSVDAVGVEPFVRTAVDWPLLKDDQDKPPPAGHLPRSALGPLIRAQVDITGLVGDQLNVSDPATFKAVEVELGIEQPLSSKIAARFAALGGFSTRLATDRSHPRDRSAKYGSVGIAFSGARGRLFAGLGGDQRLSGEWELACLVEGTVNLYVDNGGADGRGALKGMTVSLVGSAILGLQEYVGPPISRDSVRMGIAIGAGKRR